MRGRGGSDDSYVPKKKKKVLGRRNVIAGRGEILASAGTDDEMIPVEIGLGEMGEVDRSFAFLGFPKFLSLPINPPPAPGEPIVRGEYSDFILADNGCSSGVIGGPSSGIVIGIGRSVEK